MKKKAVPVPICFPPKCIIKGYYFFFAACILIFIELVILSLKRKSKLCLICCWNCGSRVTWMQLGKY